LNAWFHTDRRSGILDAMNSDSAFSAGGDDRPGWRCGDPAAHPASSATAVTSNLHAKLRVQTRTELAELQTRLAVTTVYVTHDQVEAMTMGHRVAVLRDGVLQHCDTPHTLPAESRW
jgi:hypothetical protein